MRTNGAHLLHVHLGVNIVNDEHNQVLKQGGLKVVGSAPPNAPVEQQALESRRIDDNAAVRHALLHLDRAARANRAVALNERTRHLKRYLQQLGIELALFCAHKLAQHVESLNVPHLSCRERVVLEQRMTQSHCVADILRQKVRNIHVQLKVRTDERATRYTNTPIPPMSTTASLMPRWLRYAAPPTSEADA